MKVKIEDIKVDYNIYPRQSKSNKTIEAYLESLSAGAEFPAIKLQKVIYNGQQENILLDGLHRIEAFRNAGRKEIEAVFWKDEILDKEKELNILRLYAGFCNAKHGDRISQPDKKFTARRIANDDPDEVIKEKEMAEKLNVSQSTISDWISDIRARQKASRNNLIYRLLFLGWTQEEIAEKTGLDQSSISKIMNNTEIGKIHNFLQDWLNKGKTVAQAAEKLEIDETLAWAFLLQKKDDDTRVNKLKIEHRAYTVWNFAGCHKLMGRDDFKGRIPGEIPFNFLYWFTKQGDLIVDPMAGSAPTVDACLLLNRKCKAFDLNPVRPEIEKNDILNGYPEIQKPPDAIFVDPPYWCSTDYREGLSSLFLDEFYEAIEKFAQDSFVLLKPKGYIGIIMANQSTYIPKKQGRLPQNYPSHRLEHIFMTYNLFIKAGFKPYWRIYCPLSIQNAQDWAQNEWKEGRLGEICRELLIFRKEI